MKKHQTESVMRLFAECLRQLYQVADLEIPEPFDPDIEANRLASALVAKGLGISLK
jgi:hypothetical protein